MERPDAIPGIDWYYQLALYKEGNINIMQFKSRLSEGFKPEYSRHHHPQLVQLIGHLRPHVPELARFFDNLLKVFTQPEYIWGGS